MIFYHRSDHGVFRLPTTIEHAKELGKLLSRVKETHYFSVLITLVISYILYPDNYNMY